MFKPSQYQYQGKTIGFSLLQQANKSAESLPHILLVMI